jgi:hypothetical protein
MGELGFDSKGTLIYANDLVILVKRKLFIEEIIVVSVKI